MWTSSSTTSGSGDRAQHARGADTPQRQEPAAHLDRDRLHVRPADHAAIRLAARRPPPDRRQRSRIGQQPATSSANFLPSPLRSRPGPTQSTPFQHRLAKSRRRGTHNDRSRPTHRLRTVAQDPAARCRADRSRGVARSDRCGAAGLEVVALIEVFDQPGPGGLPSQQFACDCAGCRAVEREEACEPGEVRPGLLWGDGDHRDVEVPADHLGDVTDRHAFVGDGMQR